MSKTLLLISIFPLFLTPLLFGAAPLANRTLVVYASNSPDSVTVANYYAAARAVPQANLCGVTLPDPNVADFTAADYRMALQLPVQACLNAAGKQNILYIVLAFFRPYLINVNGKLFSLDSYLADIWDQYAVQPFTVAPTAAHRYYADSQSQGLAYPPFSSFEAYRAQPRAQLIYGVWRLDGSTPAIATGLVDKATQAMATGPTLNACFDQLIDVAGQPDAGYRAGDWDLHAAALFLAQAGSAVTIDTNGEEFGTAPAPLTCPNAGFYSGWYSLNHYNDAFTWPTGAIGFHLDSASLFDPRGGQNWSANAVNHGITVTAGAVTEPFLEGLPRPGGVFRNLLEGANVADAFLRNTRWLKWNVAFIGDPLYRPFATPVTLPANNSLSLDSRALVGGVGGTTARLTLASPAPISGVTIALSANAPALVPQTVFVPGGSSTATFPVTSQTVTQVAYTVILAATNPPAQNTITIQPMLNALLVSPTSVTGGQSSTGTVFISLSAPAGGATVALSSDNPAVTVPTSVTVPAGAGRGVFAVTTGAVSAAQTVTIRAEYLGASATATLTVNP